MLENRDMPQECKNLLVKMPDLFGGIETITYVKEQTTNKRALKALELSLIHIWWKTLLKMPMPKKRRLKNWN